MPISRKGLTRNRGFSLIEMLAVLAVLGIVWGVFLTFTKETLIKAIKSVDIPKNEKMKLSGRCEREKDSLPLIVSKHKDKLERWGKPLAQGVSPLAPTERLEVMDEFERRLGLPVSPKQNLEDPSKLEWRFIEILVSDWEKQLRIQNIIKEGSVIVGGTVAILLDESDDKKKQKTIIHVKSDQSVVRFTLSGNLDFENGLSFKGWQPLYFWPCGTGEGDSLLAISADGDENQWEQRTFQPTFRVLVDGKEWMSNLSRVGCRTSLIPSSTFVRGGWCIEGKITDPVTSVSYRIQQSIRRDIFDMLFIDMYAIEGVSLVPYRLGSFLPSRQP